LKKFLRCVLRPGQSRWAFTLVELMVVVTVIAILAAAAISVYRFVLSKVYKSEAKANSCDDPVS